MPLARELGEKLGGEPWVDQILTIDPIEVKPVRPNPEIWGECVFEEEGE